MARPREAPPGAFPSWRAVHGHYVVLIGMPARVSRGATSLDFDYIDPWGGRLLKGRVRVDPLAGFPSLLVDVPNSKIGRDKVRPAETSVVSLAAALGVF